MAWLFRNWGLKLGAVALAMVLYTGLVFSGSFSDKTFPGVTVTALGQPEGTYLLTQQLGTVDIKYRSATDPITTVSAESFAVTIDLADYDMTQAPQVQSLKISVRSLDDGIEVLPGGFTPKAVSVAIDRLDEVQVRVAVDSGEVPPGLEIGTPQLSASASRPPAHGASSTASTARSRRCASIRRGSTAAARWTSSRSISTVVGWNQWS